MLIKQCQFKGKDDDGIHFHLLRPGYRNAGLTKEASARGAVLAEIDQVMRKVPRDQNLLYALVSAMGAWEYYGQNTNGDAFPEKSLIHTPPNWNDLPMKMRPQVGRNWEWGYPTFYNAHAFQHHCFPAGTPVVVGDRTRTPIDEIQVGDRVATRSGSRKVSKIMRRKYTGRGVSIRLRGNPEPLISTADHPLLVLRRDQVHCRCGYNRLSETIENHRKKCRDAQSPIGKPAWLPASEVRPGDYLMQPSPVDLSATGTKANPDFAELVGWVASEGHLGKRGLIQFSFSEDSEDIEAVRSCMERLGLHVTTTPRPQYGVVMLSACSSGMHASLSEYVVGVLSDKALTGAVLRWDRDSLLRMIGAYVDGDGSVCKSGRNSGQLRIRSSSPQMRKMLLDVIHALGEPCTEQFDAPPKDMVSPTNGKMYKSSGSGVVHVNATSAKAITTYSRKLCDKKILKNRRVLPYLGCHLVQIRDVDITELDEDVFNLEVEGEHEYIANEVVVHNCNKDPARAFGEVVHAMWDPFMKRVLLIMGFDRKRADIMGAISVIDKVENGEYPDVSMGCKVPYDLCTRCTDWDRVTGNPQVDLKNHRKDPIQGLSETTKDYCFPPEVPVTLADGTSRPISEIFEGDELVTHAGNVCEVARVMQREVDEDLVSVDVVGLPGKIRATSNHPFFVVRENDWARSFLSKSHQHNLGLKPIREPSGTTPRVCEVPAGEIRPGDRVLTPIPRLENDIGIPDALATLLGWYLAQGHVRLSGSKKASSRRWYNVVLTHDSRKSDDISGIVAAAESLGLRVRVVEAKSRNASDITIYGEWFAEQCVRFCGRFSKQKKLSDSIMTLPVRQQMLLLKSYAAGDGGINDKGTRLVTTSDDLAAQLPIVLSRCGMVSHTHLEEGETNFGHQRNWFVAVPASCSELFGVDQPSWSNGKVKIFDDYVARRVSSVELEPYTGPVYNIEVKEDHSYVAGGVAVHNCDHLTNELGRIYSDGIKAGMINLHPRFFDLSVVFIGADKTSKVMAKLAGRCPIREKAAICGKCRDCDISSTHVYEVWTGGREKVASSADNEGMLKEAFAPGDDFGMSAAEEKRLNQYFSRWKNKSAEIEKQVKSNFAPMLPKMDRREDDLPEDVLNEVSRNPSRGLCTAGSLGVVLKPREFQRTMLISMGRKPLADALDHRGMCFRTGAPPERMVDVGGAFLGPLIEKLLPLLAGRSAFGPAFHKRVIIMVSGDKPGMPEESVESDDHPLLHKLSAGYTDYRRQLMYKVARDASKVIEEYPQVLPQLFPEALDLSFSSGLAKTGGDVMQSLIGMMPSMYLNGAYLERPISDYVEANPGFEGIVAAGALAARGRVA